MGRLIDESELLPIVESLKKQGKKVGMTNGAFDLLHAGHVRFLQKAKALCDVLIVAINSDDSVRNYKGESRPLVSEADRAEIVSSLANVDFVFIFNDRRMQRLLETFKPDFYIKGGDYKPEELTSREAVEKYGGKAVILPQEGDFSTSSIINKITGTGNVYHNERSEQLVKPVNENRERSRAIFIDRDGTICEPVEYLSEPSRMKVFPNAATALKKLRELGFKVVVATNQPGIGLGYFTKEDFYAVNKEMLRQLSAGGAMVDKIYFCPHTKADNCECRKPNTGMFRRAEQDLDLDLKKCYMIGDQTSDIKAGENIGAKTVLVKTGFGGGDKNYEAKPDFMAADMAEAAEIIEKMR